MPTNFPLDTTATRSIAGMGTPDLVDSYGSFSYYTSDLFEDYPDLEGGNVLYVDVNRNVVRAHLPGPANSLVTTTQAPGDRLDNVARIPFTAYVDPRSGSARLDIQGQSIVLKCGEYSPWVKVTFDLLPVVGSVPGIARFLLKGVTPHFQLYVTPINIDPSEPATPVTYPAEFGAEIARDIGAFWTKGLPADVKAFDHRVINDEEYVGQAELILRERMALFDHQWSHFDRGLFFFYVSSTDQDAHMMWRNMDESHPMHAQSDIRFSGWIPHLYEEMDKLVGKVLPAVDDDTLVLVCSDHGFAQFARQFHLNTWLRDNGYLNLKPSAHNKDRASIFDVDWARTVAYGVGFSGLYINRVGRERDGIVSHDKVEEISSRLAGELGDLRDPETGMRPIARVYRRDSLYVGPHTPMMPELLVGYARGYRNASPSVLGSTGRSTIDLNPWAWSGDHSMAHELVPGVLLSSRQVKKANASILDLPVSILEFFGVHKPGQMVGSSILGGEPSRA